MPSVSAAVYRAAARALYAPFGGLAAIRKRALDALELRVGAHVLELGCGPGDLTAALVARGAQVSAVDSSAAMIREASRQAPSATFHVGDIRTYRPSRPYDGVLFAFVLHELLISDLSAVIANAVRALDSGGRIAVLDFAAPADARMWRGVLHAIEGRSMDAFLDVDLAATLTASGIAVSSQKLAGGRAQLHFGARARRSVG